MNHVNVPDHLKFLGYRVKDKITNFTGVCTSIGFDLYGCVQAVVNPGLDKDGKVQDSHWFDTKRLEIIDDKRAMSVPDFALPELSAGPETKPPFPKMP